VQTQFEAGTAWRFQLDTYEPEVARYGGPSKQTSVHDIFMADSDAVLEILRHHPGEPGLQDRWRLALASMDEFYRAAGFSMDRRLRSVRIQRDSYRAETGLVLDQADHALGDRFRRERPRLEALLGENPNEMEPLAQGMAALRERSRRIGPLLRAIEEGAEDKAFQDILASFIHMSINRLLLSSQRAQERILFHFLMRLYESREARTRRTRQGIIP
jgi:thiopeptide-type bacteriocin biosynthesis protein